MTADYIFAFRPAVDKVIDFRNGAIKTGNGKAFAFHIENKIFTHYSKTNKTYISFRHFHLLLN